MKCNHLFIYIFSLILNNASEMGCLTFVQFDDHLKVRFVYENGLGGIYENPR